MKKLLLALPFAAVLTACGGVESEIEELASDYCNAIKSIDWRNAEPLAKPFVIQNRQGMHEQNRQKYMQVFMNQSCNVTKIEGEETAFAVFFGGSKLDFVQIEWDKRKEKFFVTADAFKNDLKLY
ncbi:hypothetical protein [Pseudoalteromonas sp. H105]|uniref:hypothetical protein n=1 Tax=Pseudoalteromonas sp. H105 TaxID=1348393 RepID=UPI0007320B16|nr:hypothetical protein [Pseudoalteromonas sp. H105]KTF12230.1 hypothetical protein ATS75_18490 [Pseudoalteromonas sp. H105]